MGREPANGPAFMMSRAAYKFDHIGLRRTSLARALPWKWNTPKLRKWRGTCVNGSAPRELTCTGAKASGAATDRPFARFLNPPQQNS